MRDAILEALETFLQGVLCLGGDGDLSFAKPLKKVPNGLPPGAAEVFTKVSGHIEMRWHLDEEVGDALPDEFEECRFGKLDLHPKCFDAVTPKWSTGDDPLWAGKVVFAPDGSGDYLGVDPKGHIIFLSHDLDEPHGMRLASSLTDLLMRWAPLGCVGPAGVALSPFATKRHLNPKGPAAKRFLKIIGGTNRKWKAAKKAKYNAVAGRTKAIENDATGAFETFVTAITDPKLDKPWTQYHAYALDMIEKCYGRTPSPSLQALVMHTPGKQVGSFTPGAPAGATTSWQNAFVQARADVHLLSGALTNTWPIGGDYLAEVQPEADQVSLRQPLLGFFGVSDSLPAFAQRIAIETAQKNTKKKTPDPPPPATRAAALADQAKPLRALFENYAVNRHLQSMEPQPLPDDLASLDCASALRALWMSYLSGATLSLASAKAHPAAFVADAASVIESLLAGADARNPGNFLHLAREVCVGVTSWPQEHDDEEKLVNKAYQKQTQARWQEMLELADQMIECGFRLDHAWPYRVRALEALGRHEEVLAAADRALLFCEMGSAALFGAKVKALAALGEEDASEAHVWWCSPHYRAVSLKR